MSDFYYSDSCFQLELNLQETRRELIALIEACELRDCDPCNETVCCYSETDPIDNESRDDGDTHNELDTTVPPLADLLPTPKWDTSEVQPSVSDIELNYHVQSWLETGTINPSEVSSPGTACKETGNNKKSLSSKLIDKTVSDMNGINSHLESTANTGKEFCMKFAENTYNFDVITKSRFGNRQYSNTKETRSIVTTASNRDAVDEFFRSFKNAMPAAARSPTNIPIDKLVNSVQKYSRHSDYAYF